jgi:hypothetical protein
MHRDQCMKTRKDARVLPRTSQDSARAVRRRYRPEVLVPRGFLPLVVH